ncbi:hypothetical protein Saro_1191 [Novosphingobium aromaticivorans DSM 12444]|uniref:Transferrin-binding protein B C-lobe/N-lobe beta barrel domain-containing protein n=1 Tax=Novosphingobium aromaticivorans (strain ATCC 700278 / DSM 12444 / CCUG 56034 / CIP 105152 / NBRC 16084 / F199) TaxID=279238 RepID=Q2G937_NOVAD|nr:hypothetical protein [Novosphingobium aromaticivorans]ABD25636.1 hypothetical protein Saro_1191 [Novosphingobium aromaticivorans DSM 12444]SCX99226.1 hypothetical protein SAMN05660666_00527 [Novosphingobium aromaticivorans]
MSRFTRFASGAAATMLLASCGGGGGGGSVGSTPTPVYTYKTLDQLSGDQTFQSGGIAGQPASDGRLVQTTKPFGQGIEIKYFAASDTYNLNDGAGLVAEFAPADVRVVDEAAGAVQYQKVVGSDLNVLTLINPRLNGVPLSYTTIGSWLHLSPSAAATRFYLMVGGVPTQAGDVPRSGSATYTTAVGGGGTFNGTNYNFSANSTGTFSANFANNTVSTSVHLSGLPNGTTVGTPFDAGTYNGTGNISSTGPGFTGTLTGTAANGAFSGAFFGPRATEFGYAFYLDGTGTQIQGTMVGKKN